MEKQGENQTRVNRKIDAIKISFQPRSVAPTDIEPEEFSLLGLKGDFDMFIYKSSRLPVQVNGDIVSFGKEDILLHKVEISQGIR